MGLDVYSRIVVGVELKDLITFCGTVNDPVTKYNPDTGEPYETTVSRKVYRLLDGREITVEDLDGGHLLKALGLRDAGDWYDEDPDPSTALGYYVSSNEGSGETDGIIGIKVVETGSHRSGEQEASTDSVAVTMADEEAGELLAKHFGLMDTDMQVFVQTVLRY